MNRTNSGEELATADLERIALDQKCLTAEDLENRRAAMHNDNLYRSMLINETRNARFEMFMRGELALGSPNTTKWATSGEV